MLKELGFSINMDKSQLCPNTVLTFLGFELNLVDMLISLTQEKKYKLRSMGSLILKAEYTQIREVAGLIGLKRVKGNLVKMMWLSPEGNEDIKWWLLKFNNSIIILRIELHIEMFTDALEEDWGRIYRTFRQEVVG